MAETFALAVAYNNLTIHFDAELRMLGYTHKIAVMVEDIEVIFEPDEERNYRAVVVPEPGTNEKQPDKTLLKAIANQLEVNFK